MIMSIIKVEFHLLNGDETILQELKQKMQASHPLYIPEIHGSSLHITILNREVDADLEKEIDDFKIKIEAKFGRCVRYDFRKVVIN